MSEKVKENKRECPNCGYKTDPMNMRCPRCNSIMLKKCSECDGCDLMNPLKCDKT